MSTSADHDPVSDPEDLPHRPSLLSVRGFETIAEGIAHDINNLMTTILGSAALIRTETGHRHTVTPLLDSIEHAAETAASRTRQLLEFTREQSNRAECVSLNAIVYHALLAEERKLAPRIRIHRYIDPDLPRLVSTNHAGIAELTLALAANAVEAIHGEGRVIIRTRFVIEEPSDAETSGLPSGAYALLTVEDNGDGMSPDILAHVFDAAFSTKPGHKGMGLTQARETVDAAGGRIVITSSVGHGTLCQAYLPALAANHVAPPSVPSDMPRGNETVLLVDDERIILEVTRETLGRLGYRVLTARNGKEAVDIAQNHPGPIHIALLDMAMPIMGGAEAYPLLQAARPDMKVIVCTGFDPDIAPPLIAETGSNAYLVKPFRPTTLAQEIRRVLDTRE